MRHLARGYYGRLPEIDVEAADEQTVDSQPEVRKRGRAKRGSIDLPFLVLTLFILTIGVITVLSASFASAYYTTGRPMRIFMRQVLFAVSGIGLMLVVSRVKPEFMRKWSMPLLLVSILFLAVVPFAGIEENGARRWLGFGSFTFQPSEITKLAEILAFAHLISNFKNKMGTFKYGVLPFAVIVVVIVGLLILEPHLSASVIILGIAVVMMWAGGTRGFWFAIGIVAVALAGVVIISGMGYAGDRISAWRHPEQDPLDSGFQILQSLYAIGSGGLLGLGIGQSRQKYLYLPEEHNDYIFAIFCEELGFVGAMVILILFAMLIIRGFWIAMHAKNRFDFLVATGITSMLAIQVFLNVGVVTNLLPSTGISMPFFSYGGTALWIQLVEMGIVLSISRDIPIEKAG